MSLDNPHPQHTTSTVFIFFSEEIVAMKTVHSVVGDNHLRRPNLQSYWTGTPPSPPHASNRINLHWYFFPTSHLLLFGKHLRLCLLVIVTTTEQPAFFKIITQFLNKTERIIGGLEWLNWSEINIYAKCEKGGFNGSPAKMFGNSCKGCKI